MGFSALQLGSGLAFLFMFLLLLFLKRYGYCKFGYKSGHTAHHYLSWFAWKRPQLEREIVYCNSMATESHGAGKLNSKIISPIALSQSLTPSLIIATC